MNAINKKQNAIPELKGKSKPYVIAHRGNQTACPENTIASFKRAINDGADIIETDVHLTKDDEFVLIHDEFVDRTTDGKGRVSDMTLEELKKLSAGHYRAGFKSEKIPTLREAAKIIPDNVALALELKTDRFLDKNVCFKLKDELKEEKIFDRTFVLSFFMPHLEAMKENCPDIYTGWITLDKKGPVKGPDMLGPYWRIFLQNPFYVFWAHLQRQAVCPLDTDPDSRLWFYKMLCCDAVITDNSETTCMRLKKR